MKATVIPRPTPREPPEWLSHSVFKPTGRCSASLGAFQCLQKEFSGKKAKIPLDVPAQEVLEKTSGKNFRKKPLEKKSGS